MAHKWMSASGKQSHFIYYVLLLGNNSYAHTHPPERYPYREHSEYILALSDCLPLLCQFFLLVNKILIYMQTHQIDICVRNFYYTYLLLLVTSSIFFYNIPRFLTQTLIPQTCRNKTGKSEFHSHRMRRYNSLNITVRYVEWTADS